MKLKIRMPPLSALQYRKLENSLLVGLDGAYLANGLDDNEIGPNNPYGPGPLVVPDDEDTRT